MNRGMARMELSMALVALSACATSDPAELERTWSGTKVTSSQRSWRDCNDHAKSILDFSDASGLRGGVRCRR